jgi:hypothetical protein
VLGVSAPGRDVGCRGEDWEVALLMIHKCRRSFPVKVALRAFCNGTSEIARGT